MPPLMHLLRAQVLMTTSNACPYIEATGAFAANLTERMAQLMCSIPLPILLHWHNAAEGFLAGGRTRAAGQQQAALGLSETP